MLKNDFMLIACFSTLAFFCWRNISTWCFPRGLYRLLQGKWNLSPPPHPSTNVFARKVDRVNDNSLWLFGKHHHITRIWGCKYNLKQLKKQICMLGFVTKKGHSDEFSPYFVFTAATKCNQFTWNMIIELHPFFIDSSAITAIWFCLPWW